MAQLLLGDLTAMALTKKTPERFEYAKQEKMNTLVHDIGALLSDDHLGNLQEGLHEQSCTFEVFCQQAF